MTSAFHDHLNLDAIVAYADGELDLVPYQRAAAHLERCPQCAAEVREQMAARSWLRSAGSPTMPLSLRHALEAIPTAAPVTGPVAGVSVDPLTGQASRTADATALGVRSATHRGRRFRLGAGALMAGLAVGALVATAAADSVPDPQPPPSQVLQPNAGPGVLSGSLDRP